MRSASTSRFQVTGDQRHSRFDQSSTRRTASGGGRRIAAIAQVAQPGEAVQGIEPQRLGARAPPRRVVAFGRHGAGAAAGQKLAHDQALADAGSPGQVSGATAKKLRGVP